MWISTGRTKNREGCTLYVSGSPILDLRVFRFKGIARNVPPGVMVEPEAVGRSSSRLEGEVVLGRPSTRDIDADSILSFMGGDEGSEVPSGDAVASGLSAGRDHGFLTVAKYRCSVVVGFRLSRIIDIVSFGGFRKACLNRKARSSASSRFVSRRSASSENCFRCQPFFNCAISSCKYVPLINELNVGVK